MELRSIHTALLAGRAATRWAASASTTASKPSFPMFMYNATASRSFSSTRRARQQGGAGPVIDGTMSSYTADKTAQQGQQPQEQQQEQKQSPSPSQQTPAFGRANSTYNPVKVLPVGDGTMASYVANIAAQQRQQSQEKQQEQKQSPSPSQQTLAFGAANSIYSPAENLQHPWASPATRPGNRGIISTPASPASPASPDPDNLVALGISDFHNKNLGSNERPEDRKLRLRPVIGRTVDLMKLRDQKAQDLASGLTRLTMMCKVNRVKLDSNRQRFHERPGLRRKRQKAERWQKRFRVGFQASCSRVSELARQGW